MIAIFVKSVRTATIAIFHFRIRGCIRFVAVAFRSEEEVLWRRNPSLTYFWQIALPPPLDPPQGGVCQKAYKQVRDYEYFISIKFPKHPSSGSVRKADYVFQYTYIVHALVHPPPFLHLNKYIKSSLKIFKHLNLLYKPCPT